MQDDQNDLDDVMTEEKSRGRRPVSRDVQRARQLLRQGFLKLIREGDERKFLSALRGLGLRDESPEFQLAVQMWREFQQRRTRSS